MSLSSYFACGSQLAGCMLSDDDSHNSSYFAVMDYMTDLSLCCPDTSGIEAFFRPDDTEGTSDQVGQTQSRMMQPWRPPLYRDTSLLSAPSCSSIEEKQYPPSTRIKTPSNCIVSCYDSIRSRKDQLPNQIKWARPIDAEPLPPDFIPPRHPFLLSSRLERKGTAISTPSVSSPVSGLQPIDVVCGRGGPSNTHPGNLAFKKVIKEHEKRYVFSKRSEKPRIAYKLLDQFYADGVRFVKRERNVKGNLVWVEIGEQRAYEKVCQSLREGAPQFRRQLMASEALRSKTENQRQNRDSSIQQRQDTNTSRASTDRSKISEAQQRPSFQSKRCKCSNEHQLAPNVQKLYYDENGIRDHYFNISKYCDGPYYVHLPPELGGERLFRERESSIAIAIDR